MRNWPELLLLLLGLFLGLSGCSSAPKIGESILQQEADYLRSETYPTDEEILRPQRESIAFLPVQYIGELSRYHKALSTAFVQSLLEDYGNLQIVREQRVQEALSLSEFQSFDSECRLQLNETCSATALEVGRYLRTHYVALMRVTPFREQEALESWSVLVTLKVYRVDPEGARQLRNPLLLDHESFVDERWFLSSETLMEHRTEFGELIRKAFPRKGFILETRENRTYALINLGAEVGPRQGVAPGTTLNIYRRSRRASASGGTEITFDLVGQMQLVEILPKNAWGLVEESVREQILSGDVVQVVP